MNGYRNEETAAQAADDCLRALLKDAYLDTGAFLENWAREHGIPQEQLAEFTNAARCQLAAQVGLSSLARKGLGSEEYTRSRTYSLNSKVYAMHVRRQRKGWCPPTPPLTDSDEENEQ